MRMIAENCSYWNSSTIKLSSDCNNNIALMHSLSHHINKFEFKIHSVCLCVCVFYCISLSFTRYILFFCCFSALMFVTQFLIFFFFIFLSFIFHEVFSIYFHAHSMLFIICFCVFNWIMLESSSIHLCIRLIFAIFFSIIFCVCCCWDFHFIFNFKIQSNRAYCVYPSWLAEKEKGMEFSKVYELNFLL